MTMSTVYFSPFKSDFNPYIEMQKELLRASGFEVKPLSLRALFTGQAMGIFNPRNIMVFHWLETRAFRLSGDGGSSIDILGLFSGLFYILLIMVARAKVVYFMHDHASHDTQGYQKKLSVFLIKMLIRFSDARVVHDPSYAETFHATYLPHPLYWDTGDVAIKGIMAKARPSTPSPQPRFGILGMIRAYKGIERILKFWPQDVSLVIRGHGEPEYCAELGRLIEQRNLAQHVSLVQGFLSPEAFDQALSDIDALILPHLPGTMLVSGAFFEGIGRVKCIIARRTPFITWVAGKLPGIYPFDEDAEIPAIVAAIQADWSKPGTDAAQGAKMMFGWAHCSSVYREFFTQLTSSV